MSHKKAQPARQAKAANHDHERSEPAPNPEPPLTAASFRLLFKGVLLDALEHEDVQTAFQATLGPLIDTIVEERTAQLKADFNEKLHEKELKCRRLESEVSAVKAECEAQKQYSQREDLLIKNWECKANEGDLSEKVVNFAKEKLRIDIAREDISISHPLRAPRAINGRQAPPTIIVRFARRESRNRMFERRKYLKGSNIFLEEHLTKSNSTLLFEARKLKQEGKILACFSSNCKPVAKLLCGRLVNFSSLDELRRSLPEST